MAANRGATLFVLLLCCCHKAEQPVNTSSGTVAVDRVADEILVQEILNPNKSSGAETPRTATTPPKALFKGEKNANTDEDEQVGAEPPENAQFSPSNEDKILNNESSANDSYQVGGPEDHDVAPDPQALDSEGGAHVFEETENMVPMAVVAAAAATGKTHLIGAMQIYPSPKNWQIIPSNPRAKHKKNSKNDPYESLSVLDKILKKIGKFSGNLSSKLKRTGKPQRAESGQHGHQLREISVKNEILTE